MKIPQQVKRTTTPPASQRGSRAPFFPPLIQPKLSINQPGDVYEQEADAMADKVMQMPENAVHQTSVVNSALPIAQRKCNHCEEEKSISRKQENNGGGIANTPVENYIGTLGNKGRTLTSEERHFFEPKFGYNFSDVQLHTDSNASQSAKSINALAYTHGNNIVFGSGQYQPGTETGKRLIAHELTHVIQQKSANGIPSVQRDLAIEPTTPVTTPTVLTAAQIHNAIVFNQHDFTEADELRMLRDVLGVSRDPAVVDEDFVKAVAVYQAGFGLTADGKLGRTTAVRLATEITAEADAMADPVKGTERRRIARRMQLRGMVSNRAGTLMHRDFVGDHDRPTGMVSARIGGDEHTAFGTPQANNVITLEYTGENAADIRWLQFINIQMQGFQPGVAAPNFNAGAVNATGGAFNYSNAGTTNWGVDSGSATVPFYDAAGINIMTARSSIMGDQPQGWQPTANAFAATLAPAANRVVLVFNFDSYAVRNGTTPVYHIRWSATYEFNITAGTESVIRYSRIGGGAIRALAAAHRAAIDARYAGNGVL